MSNIILGLIGAAIIVGAMWPDPRSLYLCTGVYVICVAVVGYNDKRRNKRR